MQRSKAEAKAILERYQAGTCTEAERRWVEEWYEQQPTADVQPDETFAEQDLDEVLERLRGTIRRRRMHRLRKGLSVAAIFILSCATGALLYFHSLHKHTGSEIQSAYGGDVLPGGNRATLTLADGSHIQLSEDKQGIIIDDAFTYDDGTPLTATVTEYATLATPRGGQYQLTLPDGTKVWLNAASSLRYPTSFQETERRVELTGEGYFDVAPNAEKPFVVSSNGQEVNVLGTEFNINAYENRIITTLVTGKISLAHQHADAITLHPNEQAVFSNNSFSINPVEVNDIIAWKDGWIALDCASLEETIKQVERWYDVDFKLPDEVKNSEKAYINLDRSERLSSVLKALEHTYGMHFTVKGREVIAEE